MARKICLLTGGTGFVGSFLAVELLRKGCFVIFLARSKRDLSAEERVEQAISFVDPEICHNKKDFFKVLKGDVTKEGLGMSLDDRKFLMGVRPEEIFNSAGSVDFAEKNRAWTEAVNYGGVANILRLATDLRIKHFHHMSTLYVAGNRKGDIMENELFAGQEFNNVYEETKAKAEDLIRFWSRKMDIPHSIYRLPIIIGDSRTGKTSSFTGFYGFFKPFWNLEKNIRAKINDSRLQNAGIYLSDGHVSAPLFVKCSDFSSIDLVPIDWVVKVVSVLNLRCTKNLTFHLGHELAPSSTAVIKEALPLLGLEGLRFVKVNGKKLNLEHENRTLKAFQRMVDAITEIYFAYTVNRKTFDNSNLVRILGDDYNPPPRIDDKALLSTMLNFAKRAEFKKPCFA